MPRVLLSPSGPTGSQAGDAPPPPPPPRLTVFFQPHEAERVLLKLAALFFKLVKLRMLLNLAGKMKRVVCSSFNCHVVRLKFRRNQILCVSFVKTKWQLTSSKSLSALWIHRFTNNHSKGSKTLGECIYGLNVDQCRNDKSSQELQTGLLNGQRVKVMVLNVLGKTRAPWLKWPLNTTL